MAKQRPMGLGAAPSMGGTGVGSGCEGRGEGGEGHQKEAGKVWDERSRET